MTVTIVLRLLRGPLDRDEIVGHAEVVATGASHPVRALGDVLAIARAAAKDPAMQDGDATGGGSWGGNSGSSGSRDNAAAPRGELGA